MKTINSSRPVRNFEFLKRFLYSFQVLMVGIAIPVLFMIGISTPEHRKAVDTEMGAGQSSGSMEKSAVVINVGKNQE